MRRKKTHEQYVIEVSKINPNIEVIGLYIDAKTKVEHKCKIDGNVWAALPNLILRGHGCRECMKKKLHDMYSKTHEDYVNEVLNINPDIEVVGEYLNASTPILHKCKRHNIEWLVLPMHILEGSGCIKCKGEKIYNKKVKDIETYKKDVYNIDTNIEVIGEYINARTHVLHRCNVCGCLWNATPDNILSGYGCPECSMSKGEKKVKKYLTDRGINYIPQYTFDDCKNYNVLPFDFYLPDYNICIEYDGIQHFKPIDFFGGQETFDSQMNRDRIKTNYCLLNNINLIRIKYNDDVFEILEQNFNNIKIIKEVM